MRRSMAAAVALALWPPRPPAPAAWQRVDEQVMADAAIVPLGEESKAVFVSRRVLDWSPSAFFPAGDLPNIRVKA